MYDFVIIGGGIIGMLIVMQLIEIYLDVCIVLLEKEVGLVCYQIGYNSGVIYVGVYYMFGSFKVQFCFVGNCVIKVFCEQNGICYDVCGKMLVVILLLEMEWMCVLWDCIVVNGLQCEWLSVGELCECELNIIGFGGIFVFFSGIVSYCEVVVVMVKNFEVKGGMIVYNVEVSVLKEYVSGVVICICQGGEYEVLMLIVCLGLMVDWLVKMFGVDFGFIICLFCGEYFQLVLQYNQIVNYLIYLIFDLVMLFFGVYLICMIDGSVIVGFNVVLVLKCEGYCKCDILLVDILEIFILFGICWVL